MCGVVELPVYRVPVFDNFRSSARRPELGDKPSPVPGEKEKEGERERETERERGSRACTGGDHFDPGVAVRRGTLNPELAVEVRRGVGLGGVKTFVLRCVSLAFP